MKNFNNGLSYDRTRLDSENEQIPNVPIFAAVPGEKLVLEDSVHPANEGCTDQIIGFDELSFLDSRVLCLIASYANCCATHRAMSESLIMAGISFGKGDLGKSLSRLYGLGLITYFHLESDNGYQPSLRFFILTNVGLALVRENTKLIPKVNLSKMADMQPYEVKGRAQIMQLACNYIKHIDGITRIAVRPVFAADPKEGRIVRPALIINMFYRKPLFFEVPRRHEGWQEDLLGKLGRYFLVFNKYAMPTLIINGEDEEMNREAAMLLREHNVDMEIYFTDDLATFGPAFRYSIYGFDANGDRQDYEIMDCPKNTAKLVS